MAKQRVAHCRWCSRDDVPITKKGWLSPHLGPGGQRCVGFDLDPGSGEDFDTRTPPKRRHKITNKRPGKSRKGGAANRS